MYPIGMSRRISQPLHGILPYMQLVALVGSDPTSRALARYRDPEGRVWLHPVPDGRVHEAVTALPVLGFAGALIFGEEAGRTAAHAVGRRSLEAADLDTVDAVAVAGDSTLGDFTAGRAILASLRDGGWEPRGARVAALGGGTITRALLRELAAAGADEVVLVARHAPDAERGLPDLPAGVRGHAVAAADPHVPALLERCDLLLRSEDVLPPMTGVLGPHLTLLDLQPDVPSAWRREARAVGAHAASWADVEAGRVAAALRTVVGGEVDPAPLLDLLHGV